MEYWTNLQVPTETEYEWEVHARYQRLALKNHEEIDTYVEREPITASVVYKDTWKTWTHVYIFE